MKTSFITSACAAFIAFSASVHADSGIYRGTTVNKIMQYSFDGSASQITKMSRTDTQIGISSTLGNDFYALYTLDKKLKIAYQYQGEYLGCGPSHYVNIAGKGKSLEIHPQFNAWWADDLADVGDEEDILNSKSGYLVGNRKGIKLKEAGFTINAAPSLKGFHTHTRWSKDFRPDPLNLGEYLAGNFFEINSSKSSFRFDTKLSDKANALGGSLLDAVSIVNLDLEDKGYTIVPLGGFPQF
ncbi:hypothetical protein WJU23_12140 [Prosthecobacter sp. SYSU 5D2]|uniref:hypothetical protein n=1 Tax=Prosthecobacter sp. SYSU 5D2 TaxID=3134134 RepID=UPI0031FF1145